MDCPNSFNDRNMMWGEVAIGEEKHKEKLYISGQLSDFIDNSAFYYNTICIKGIRACRCRYI